MHERVYKFAFAAAAAQLSSAATAIVVDSEADAPATIVGGAPACVANVGGATRCTLRAAIQTANFDGGSTVIELQRGGRYVLSAVRDAGTDGHAGALTIGPGTFAAVAITVRAVGAGSAPATITKSDAFDDSLFHVIGQGAILELDAIALRGSAAAPPVAQGGAVRCDHAGSVFSVDSVFAGNSAARDGGALFLDDCGANLQRTGFTANASGGSGGAVALRNGFLFATAASFADNIADTGAAIDTRSETADFGVFAANVTFRGNVARDSAVHAQNSVVVLHSDTAIGQASPTFIDQDGGMLQVANTAIVDGAGRDSIRLHGMGVLRSLGNNRLQQVDSPEAPAWFLASDRLHVGDVQVSVRSAAQWPGIVAVPVAGSPLIGQGGGEVLGSDGSASPLCPELDANLVSRVAMQRCDIGAANFADEFLPGRLALPEPRKAVARDRPVRIPAARRP